MSDNIIILSVFDGHNSGACILKNGEIISAIQEERLTRIKNEAGYPKLSVEKVLELAKVRPDDLTSVALAGKLSHKKEFYQGGWDWYKLGYSDQQKNERSTNIKKLEDRLPERKKEISNHLKISENKIIVFDHHLSHAASAYYGSGWSNDESVLILTCDGAGDGISATVSVGQYGKIKRLETSPTSASIGKIYSRITLLMGMKPWDHEYKIMGLAPYADPNGAKKSYNVLNELVSVPEGSLSFKQKSEISTHFCYQYLKENLENHRFDWIAGGVQKLTEDLLIKWIQNTIKKTGIKSIVCAGGVFMNIKANMHILELPEVENLFVFPSGGDESLMIGAAYLAYTQHLDSINSKITIPELGSIYFGTEYSDEEIENSIKQSNLDSNYSVEFHDDINDTIVDSLTSGVAVARFDGRMEWGARSLGNRSILADPSKSDIVKNINMAIKQRDFWMPFAPSILSEFQNELIQNPTNHSSPYMTMGFRTTERSKKDLTAGIHPYDFTARPQILEKNANPKYHDLISKFYEKTGIPGILNTSFNLHGEPIVCTPFDAIKTLTNSGLQKLVLGSFLISKN